MTITDERMALIELIMEAKVALGPLQYTVLIQH